MIASFTLADAYREFLPDVEMCVCAVCFEHAKAATRWLNPGVVDSSGDDERAYWATHSARLRALAEGRHQRMSIAERAELEREKLAADGRGPDTDLSCTAGLPGRGTGQLAGDRPVPDVRERWRRCRDRDR